MDFTQRKEILILLQWWDIGKTLVQQFCKQYTRNVTKYIIRSLQDLETEVPMLLGCTGDQGSVEVLKSKKAALANLLGVTAHGALVCSCFLNASLMDSLTQFFFGLGRRNGQRKILHCLHSENGSSFTETTDIRRYATQFYKGLFNTELVEDPELDTSFLSDLPLVEATTNCQLDAELTVEELHGTGRLRASTVYKVFITFFTNFYKIFWLLQSQDMLEMFQDSFQGGCLPLSCRRAIITLLPKKGDLQQIKNWRPVSLLCGFCPRRWR